MVITSRSTRAAVARSQMHRFVTICSDAAMAIRLRSPDSTEKAWRLCAEGTSSLQLHMHPKEPYLLVRRDDNPSSKAFYTVDRNEPPSLFWTQADDVLHARLILVGSGARAIRRATTPPRWYEKFLMGHELVAGYLVGGMPELDGVRALGLIEIVELFVSG